MLENVFPETQWYGFSAWPAIALVVVGASAASFYFWARNRFQRAAELYLAVPSRSGLSGADVARRLLDLAGSKQVPVVPGKSFWGNNHFHPLSGEVVLSQQVFDGTSIWDLSIAAHEAGHAVQHAERYLWSRIRLLVIYAGHVSFFLGAAGIVYGMVSQSSLVTWASVGAFGICALTHIANLPVEFDASARARKLAVDSGILQPTELPSLDRILGLASMTYVSRAVGAVAAMLVIGMIAALGPELFPVALFDGEYSILIVAIIQVVAVVGLTRLKKRRSGQTSPGALEHLNRGLLLIKQGQWSEAESVLTKAIRLDSRNAAAHACRGTVYLHTCRLDEALFDFNNAISLAPNLVDAYLQRGQILIQRRKFDAALADFDAADRLAPTRIPGPALGRATVWMDLGQYDRAIEEYDLAADFGSCRPVVLCSRGLAWMLKGDLGRALVDTNEAIRLLPDEAINYNNRGTILMKRGEYAEARADLQRAIRLNPKHPNAFKNLAWLQATCPDSSFRNGAEAEANAARAWQLNEGRSAEWLEILAAAHAEAGQFDKAVDCQSRFLAACPAKATPEQQARLDDYRAGRPYRDCPASPRHAGEVEPLPTAV